MGMDIAIDLSQNAAGCINVGPACQDQHQPDSPEFTLHHSISKKFTIQNLFGKGTNPIIDPPIKIYSACIVSLYFLTI